MKYFIDTEFIEGFHKPLFGKARHFIDLISIGIVCEDGRKYYAISSEWKYKDADKWVQENIITPCYENEIHGDLRNHFDATNFHKTFGSRNRVIAEHIAAFCKGDNIEFYGYYADYDWVLFCSLFGRMIDLPKGFPMYCKDLKQMMDEKGLDKEWKQTNHPDPIGEHNALVDAEWNKKLYELLQN